MNLPKFAKSAAVLTFTSGVENHKAAAEIYDALENSAEGETVSDVLDRFPPAQRWAEVEHMTDEAWWEEIQMLANSILAARDFFEV